MIELNKVLLVGRLTRDPETRYTNSGTAICNFSLAVNRRRGKDSEEVSFIECQAWDKQAEFVQQWFTKGKPILVEGRLKQDRWEDKTSGQQRSKLLVVCDRASFVGGKSDDDGDGDDRDADRERRRRSEAAFPGNKPPQEQQAPEDDDLPF